MGFIQIIVLALIQGLTEFLPVSSSAHLILGGKVFGWEDQGLVFDVATHLGTLLAVLFYFRQELRELAGCWLAPVRSEDDRRHRRMGLYLAAASVPALAAGYFGFSLIEEHLRDVRVIAWSTIGFGLLLWLADAVGGRRRVLRDMDWKSAIVIGLAQVLALVPGASRSGMTIMAGRAMGFGSDAAARFSFLLAVPVIAGAGAYGAWKVGAEAAPIGAAQFMLAVLFAALAGWVCIAAFLALLKRVGLLPFVIYRLALGLALLWLIN